MKKLLSILLIFFSVFGFNLPFVQAKEDRTFIVTAYYSPLPGQDYYMRGDLESEKILQGNGTHGASGKSVFSGMLAAPKTYNFGTKIYIEGLGVGEVADRGGAIVQAGKKGHKYDRIDVWMGYGDEGLKRALAWGKRTVKGKIVSSSSAVSFNYKNRVAPDWAVNGLKKKQEKTIFDYNIGKESSPEKIKKLQIFLQKAGIYKGKIDGKYSGEVMDIIFDFQLAHAIIQSENDYGAGYFGPKTRYAFKKMYKNGNIKREYVVMNKKQEKGPVKKEETKQKELSAEEKIISDLENQKNKDVFQKFAKTDEEIKETLEVMKKLDLYNGKTQLEYQEFVSVVYNFQIKNNIVTKESDIGAGYFGPKTRGVLKNLYHKQIDKEIAQEKIRQEEEKKKKEIEKKYELAKVYAQEKAEKIKKDIGVLKKGDVSIKVRNLQNTLKELGYFNYNDTAIFGDITKKAVADFQVEYNLVENHDSQYAGIMGEKTLEKLEKVLYTKYYEEKIDTEKLEKLVVSL